MNITVSGANGFIGSHLTAELSRHNHNVRAICQPGTAVADIDGVATDIVYADIRDTARLASHVRNADAVIHLAALVSDFGRLRRYHDVNVVGTQQLLDASIAQGVNRFLLISSLAVHELGNHDGDDEKTPTDVTKSSYGISKKMAEDIVMSPEAVAQIETVIVRPGFFPFGPRDRHNFSRVAHQMRTGILPLVNKGRSFLCTAYVDNLVYGIRLALESKRAGGNTYVINDGLRIDWHTLLSKIAVLIGAKQPTLSFPYPLALMIGTLTERICGFLNAEKEPSVTAYRAKIAASNVFFSNRKARDELGYDPPVSLEHGLATTAEWFLKTLPTSNA